MTDQILLKPDVAQTVRLSLPTIWREQRPGVFRHLIKSRLAAWACASPSFPSGWPAVATGQRTQNENRPGP